MKRTALILIVLTCVVIITASAIDRRDGGMMLQIKDTSDPTAGTVLIEAPEVRKLFAFMTSREVVTIMHHFAPAA